MPQRGAWRGKEAQRCVGIAIGLALLCVICLPGTREAYKFSTHSHTHKGFAHAHTQTHMQLCQTLVSTLASVQRDNEPRRKARCEQEPKTKKAQKVPQQQVKKVIKRTRHCSILTAAVQRAQRASALSDYYSLPFFFIPPHWANLCGVH